MHYRDISKMLNLFLFLYILLCSGELGHFGIQLYLAFLFWSKNSQMPDITSEQSRSSLPVHTTRTVLMKVSSAHSLLKTVNCLFSCLKTISNLADEKKHNVFWEKLTHLTLLITHNALQSKEVSDRLSDNSR